MSNNKYVKKAEKELEYLTGDEESRRLAYLREKAIRDEASAILEATRVGKEKGKIEEKIKTAKKMLEKGIDIETIIEITSLSKEEIENL